MSFLVVENLDESDQFILGRDFIRNFDVTIDLNNAMFRTRNPERKYVIKPVNLIMANENKAPVFLSRRVRFKANEAAIVSLRMKNYNEPSDDKQVCIVPNPNSQSAAVLGISFSITKSGLCVSVLMNTFDIPITIQRGRKLGYALPVKTRYEMTENVKENEVLDCPNHRDKICILRRLKKINNPSGLVKSLKSETDDGLSSCSNFPERPTLEEMEMDKPVLPEIEHLMMGTNDASRGESRKVMRLHEKMSCILEELRIQMDPVILTICTVPNNMMANQHAMEMNEKVRNIKEIIRQMQQRSMLPVRLLDVADMMERSFPYDESSECIHFDRPKGLEWLNGVFQKHINTLEADLLELGQFTFGPPPVPPFCAMRSLSNRLGVRVDSRDSSRSSRTRLPGSTPMETEEAESSTPQSSVVSSVVVVDHKRVEKPTETSRTRYLERIKELDLEDLECRQELAETLGLEHVSHKDLSRHHLKAHEAHFSRARMMETADLTGIPLKSIMGPINYRPLKLLGSPGLIVEPPKHRTSVARFRLAFPAQLTVVDKLLEPKEMGLPDAAYEGGKLANDSRYGRPCGTHSWPRHWQFLIDRIQEPQE